jgi:hypothetical protein
MTTTIRQACITELTARYAAYTWPEIESGTGTWTLKSVDVNPDDLELGQLPALALLTDETGDEISLENYYQFLHAQPMKAIVRIGRFKDPIETAHAMIDYLLQATIKNTSGTVDFTLGGNANNMIMHGARAYLGPAKQPYIDIELDFDVQFVHAVSDPTAIV